jgi:4-diphosphocytidyl-2-C-methyl-D-erythritol kinase
MLKVDVPSVAKLNLDLRVLYKRPDGYHELRTIFQTITLRDRLSVEFERARRTRIELESSVDIPDNLVLRAANVLLAHLKINAAIRFRLRKRIPMGAGLGGGSSNAAAVLIALPALAGRQVHRTDLIALAEELGSDIPFFLFGGTALALGRGTELYPLPDQPAHPIVVLSTGIHVSTAEAYRALGRRSQVEPTTDVTNALTSPAESRILREFQKIVWTLGDSSLDGLPLRNDFERPVFEVHPELASGIRKLRRLGAAPALMSGSGSALFGVFPSANQAATASSKFPDGVALRSKFLSRRQYEALWRRALGPAAEASCFNQ